MPYGFNNDKSKYEFDASYTKDETDALLATKSNNNHTHSASQITNLCNVIYPIGSIYMSVNNKSPAGLFGGTWVQIKDTFLLAAGNTYTPGSTGGEAEHTLTTAEMPSHNHKNSIGIGQSSKEATGYALYSTSAGGFQDRPIVRQDASSLQINIGNTGSGNAHNNMPPYLAVYVWKRTA